MKYEHLYWYEYEYEVWEKIFERMMYEYEVCVENFEIWSMSMKYEM